MTRCLLAQWQANESAVRAEGRTIHVGRRVATASGKPIGPDGKLYAHASTTCLTFDHPPETPKTP